MRRELAEAREQARRDPAWLRTFWPVWLALLALGFAVAETIAIVNPGKGGTLTERVRLWLGVDPPAPRRRGSAGAFAAVLLALAVWLVPHMTDWPWSWPWE